MARTLALLGALVGLLYGAVGTASPVIVQLTVAGDINPATVSYIRRGIRHAQDRQAALLLIKLNTPGGQMIATQQITSEMLTSPVPVGVWVAPDGARAASAGTFIVYAAHVAGMAPSTTIGAAHPVLLGGMPGPGTGEPDKGAAEELATMRKKIVNDAVAQIEALARRRGRNAQWAQQAVRESVTATADEAVALKVADFMASTADEFAHQAAGREAELPSGKTTLATSGAIIEPLDMKWRESLLSTIAHPNIAYILLLIGVYAIIFELKSPGFGGAGVVGVICLILGLYALSVLPFNWAGLVLIVAGLAFLVAELYAPTHGALGLGGLVAFVIGSLMLVDVPGMRVSRPLIAGATVGTAGFFLLALGAVARSHRRPVTVGPGALAGRTGVARERLGPDGLVHVDGALWSAVTDEPPIEPGERIVVVQELPGMWLQVKRQQPVGSHSPEQTGDTSKTTRGVPC